MKPSQEKAALQQGKDQRRPGVRTATDKALACGEPTVAQVRAGMLSPQEYLTRTGRAGLVTRPQPQHLLKMRRAEQLAHELAKAEDDDAAAAEDEENGLPECAEFRRDLARRRRQDCRDKGAARYGLKTR